MTIKKLLLLLLIVPLVFAIQSCGKGAGSGYTPPGSGPGDPVYIKLKPSRYAAQTNGCIEFYAEVHDAQGELLANIPVQFTNLSEPFGQLLDRCGGTEIAPPVVINTDGWGRARVTLYSTTPGFASVLAQTYTGEQPRDRKTVLFSFCSTYECLVLAPSLRLDVDSVPGDGIYNEASDFIIFEPPPDPDNTVELLATVRDPYGVRIPDTAITWGSDHAEAMFTRTEAYTNENGQATGIVEVTPLSLRDTDTHVTVWALAPVGAYNVVTLFLRPVVITSVTVTADPSVVAPEADSTITATVMLNTGDPVPDGVTVIFTTCDAALCDAAMEDHCTMCPSSPSCGAVDPFAQTLGGIVTATFTAPPLPNTCRVTATANSVNGSVDIIVTTALTVTPDSIDVNGTVGGTATFTIFGGVAPYTVISDSIDPNLQPNPATVAASGDIFDVVVPAGTADATVTYTIRDSAGDEVTAEVNITADALAVLPDNVDVDGIVGGTATFTIFGGGAPYTVFSDSIDPNLQPNPATVAASGDTFDVVVPAGTADDTVTYTIRDSAGDEVTATLDITVEPLAVIPSNIDVNGSIGGTATFTINDGVPGYTITSDSADPNLQPAPPTVGVSGGTFVVTVPAGTSATTVTYTVMDSAGDSVSATVTVFIPPLTIAPSTATVDGAGPYDVITFTITGGVPPYIVQSDDVLLASVCNDLNLNHACGGADSNIWNGTLMNGATIDVTVPAGAVIGSPAATLTVFDSDGASTTAVVNVL